VVRPKEARRLLGNCSPSRLYELVNSGELETFLSGSARYITVKSIEAYIERKLAEPKVKVGRPRRPLRVLP
jgi:hypothetical protein